jgi:hypothetical protein
MALIRSQPTAFGKLGRVESAPAPARAAKRYSQPAAPAIAKLTPAGLIAAGLGTVMLGSVTYVALAPVNSSAASAVKQPAPSSTASIFARPFGCLSAAIGGKAGSDNCGR